MVTYVVLFLLVGIMLSTKQFMDDGGQLGLNAMAIAEHKLHHGFLQAFSLGLMCNILVCLAVWMTFSAQLFNRQSHGTHFTRSDVCFFWV
ncbi:formate/nitrite transporter family protein [Vibrio metschnikovii]